MTYKLRRRFLIIFRCIIRFVFRELSGSLNVLIINIFLSPIYYYFSKGANRTIEFVIYLTRITGEQIFETIR